MIRAGMGRLDDHGCAPRPRRDERGAVQDDPGPRPREHAGQCDLARLVSALRRPQRAARDGMHGRGQLARIPVAVREVGEPALDAGRRGLDVAGRSRGRRARASPATAGRSASPTRSAVRAPCRQIGCDRLAGTPSRRCRTWARRARDRDRPPPRPRPRPSASRRSSPGRRPSPCSCATRGLEDGSPPVASCRVEIPGSERATSEILLTSSP